MAQNSYNATWNTAPTFMPAGNSTWSQATPRPPVRPAVAGYGGAGYNAYSGGSNAGLLSNGKAYVPANTSRTPPAVPPIRRPNFNNFGQGNGPGGYGGGNDGNGGGYYGGGDPF